MKKYQEKMKRALELAIGEPVAFDGEAFETADGRRFAVYTDAQATAAARRIIIGELWAFRSRFILEHSRCADDFSERELDEAAAALEKIQGELCESCGPLVRCLLSGRFDDFIDDAIDADGRGHFIATYDGQENEIEGGFFVYRLD